MGNQPSPNIRLPQDTKDRVNDLLKKVNARKKYAAKQGDVIDHAIRYAASHFDHFGEHQHLFGETLKVGAFVTVNQFGGGPFSNKNGTIVEIFEMDEDKIAKVRVDHTGIEITIPVVDLEEDSRFDPLDPTDGWTQEEYDQHLAEAMKGKKWSDLTLGGSK